MVAEFDYDSAKFDAVYHGGELLPGSGIVRVPWDIGMVQPEIARLAKMGWFRGRVLDAGCGLGENAEYLASTGCDVVAIDAASSAVAEATRRHPRARAEFRTADVLSLTREEHGEFDAIIDSALFHALPRKAHVSYAKVLRGVAKVDASLTILTFANRPNGMPEPLSRNLSEIIEVLECAGWDISSTHVCEYLGEASSVEHFLSKHGISPRRNEYGFNLLPAWVINCVNLRR